MANAVIMTGYGPPEVLQWAAVPLPEPGQGQIRIKVRAAGISPTDLAGGPRRVITLSDPAAADFGVTLSEPTPERAPGALDETIALLAEGRLRLRAHQSMPMQEAAEAHRQLESGTVHERIVLTLP
jgi:NADPH:quinone reductase-like Zn-dependent oxidoreductase